MKTDCQRAPSARRPGRRADRFRKPGELPMEGLSRGGGLAISLRHRRTRTVTDRQAGLTLGFLTVLHDAAGFTGGYLVTNAWGRPLEFRLTTPVQPNRVQQILYGATLGDYIHADLIGKTLVDKTSVT